MFIDDVENSVSPIPVRPLISPMSQSQHRENFKEQEVIFKKKITMLEEKIAIASEGVKEQTTEL